MSTTTAEPTTPEPSAPAAEQPAPEKAPAQETDWKAEARKWEQRAKDNKSAAEKLAQIEEANKTAEQKAADAAAATAKERDDALAEAARLRAAVKFKLTEDDLEHLAGIPADRVEAIAEWVASRTASAGKPPAAPSAAGQGNVGKPIGSPGGQLTRADLAGMTPEAITQAKADGRLNDLLGIK